MYEGLKKVAKSILPKSFFQKNEDFIRSIVALKYKGNNYTCNVCNYNLSTFIELEKKDKLCPKCGSLSRTRRLWKFINEEIGLSNKKILHFSPPKCLREAISKSDPKVYITTDYEGEFSATKRLDIENIDEPDASYDLIICYHVLEHIVHDLKAMEELYRITKKGGQCVIQTPFKEGDIFEDFSKKTKKERLKYFGQEDHVRIYSVEGLKNRLESVGFQVQVHNFTIPQKNTYGLKEGETTLLITK
jgi:SAM-dependent methyltransferase